MTRGYLCRSCNVREARSYEDHWMTWRAGQNPAHIFGWEYEYVSPSSALIQWHAGTTTSSDTMRRGAEAAGRIG